MKRMVNNKDGYILAYVLVIVAVVSLISVAACTTALRNNRAQKGALSYTEDKYFAEGIVERFAAELQPAAATIVSNVAATVTSELITSVYEEAKNTDLDANRYEVNLALIKNEIIKSLKQQLVSEEPDAEDGIIEAIENDGVLDDGTVVYTVDWEASISSEFVRLQPDAGIELKPEDYARGYYDVDIPFSVTHNDICVSTIITLRFAVNKLKGNDYQITGASFEYTSYSVSRVSQGGVS